MPWISRIAGPEPATRNARRYPWMVRNCSEGVSSRTGRRLGFRSVKVANFVVGAECRLVVVVLGLVVGLLCEEPLELGAEFVSAGQIFIARQ